MKIVKRNSVLSTLLVGALVLAGCGGGGGGTLPTIYYDLVPLATGLDNPIQYKAVPGQPTLAYVVERTGKIKVLVSNAVQSSPLLDLTGQVTSTGEGGVFGIAFDPDFATNRRIYVHYSVGANLDTQITRYTVAGDFLSASSARKVLSIPQSPFTNHKGGSINFGGDGYLYLAMGDGGGANDPNNRAQDGSTLLGKMLRIDVNGDDFPTDSDTNYSIPSTNPFASSTTVRKEIWAVGLRNPFRWNYDANLNGFFLADVGQDAVEEVSYIPAAQRPTNFGWPLREGDLVTAKTGTFMTGTTLVNPFTTVNHPDGESIIGGYRYTGPTLSLLNGKYLMLDFITGTFWSVPVTLSGGTVATTSSKTVVNLGRALSIPVSIDADANGEPVITELGGTVSRIVPLAVP